MDGFGLLNTLLNTPGMDIISKSGGLGATPFTMSTSSLKTLKLAIVFVYGTIPMVIGSSGTCELKIRGNESSVLQLFTFTVAASISGQTLTVTMQTQGGGIRVTAVAFGVQ